MAETPRHCLKLGIWFSSSIYSDAKIWIHKQNQWVFRHYWTVFSLLFIIFVYSNRFFPDSHFVFNSYRKAISIERCMGIGCGDAGTAECGRKWYNSITVKAFTSCIHSASEPKLLWHRAKNATNEQKTHVFPHKYYARHTRACKYIHQNL